MGNFLSRVQHVKFTKDVILEKNRINVSFVPKPSQAAVRPNFMRDHIQGSNPIPARYVEKDSLIAVTGANMKSDAAL